MKSLKCQPNADVNNIRYVSQLLRRLPSRKNFTSDVNSLNDDEQISKNFWRYAKLKLEAGRNILPTFNLSSCTKYFINMWRSLFPTLTFTMPDWIPPLSTPTHQFNSDPPTYARLTSIIRKMKSNSSACPLDQFSIISLKHSAYLRTYLTAIIQNVWKSGQIPEVWKKAVTILIHKKDSPDDPQNFRPITLQSVPLKIFMSALRNTMYEFLLKNGFIENSIQKGFTPGMSGTFEHTSHLVSIYVLIRFTQTNVNHFTLSKLKTKQYDSILAYAQAYQPNAVYFDVNTLHVIFHYYIILYCISQNALLYLKTHIVCDF